MFLGEKVLCGRFKHDLLIFWYRSGVYRPTVSVERIEHHIGLQ